MGLCPECKSKAESRFEYQLSVHSLLTSIKREDRGKRTCDRCRLPY